MSKLQLLQSKLLKLESELDYIQSDVGYQSRYAFMMPNYKPLVERVHSIEQKLDAIIKHLELKVDYEQGYTVKKGE